MDGLNPVSDKAIDHLASLTAQRDRELLDVSLAQGVLELLSARSVGVYRLLGHEGDVRRWLCCGLARKGQLIVSDPPWVDMVSLPLGSDFPLREEALSSRTPMQSDQPVVAAMNEGQGYVIVLPLLVELGTPGVLEVYSDTQHTPASLRPIQTLLKVFANFQSLLESSQRDALTGLLNRQTFDGTFLKTSMPSIDAGLLPTETERRADKQTGYWLGMIDIDHFKRVNDGFGHLIGDEVLVLLARIMRQSFRHSDRLYRFGGEEFVVLLRCASESDARAVFERFRINVESYAFPQVGRATISLGFTEVKLHDTPNGAFSRADQAVYQAKHQGRNQVICFEAEVRSGSLKSEDQHLGDMELF
jgi:diguanylate cyclase (GGDEF)-like protein